MNKEISILSLNCFGAPQSPHVDERFEVIISEILRLSPNIITLQEVITPRQKQHLTMTLRKAGYTYFYKRDAKFRNGGLVSFTNLPSRFEGFYKYKIRGSPFPLAITDRFLGKGFLSIVVTLDDNSKALIVNTHLLSSYIGHQVEDYCIGQQISQLLDYLDKTKFNKVVVTGDFNIDEKTYLYRLLVSGGGLYDPLHNKSLETYSMGNTTVGSLPRALIREDIRIDFTLFKGFDTNAITQKIIFREPYDISGEKVFLSDHFGLLSRVRLS